MQESKFLRDFRAARRASVPEIAVETSDPASAMRQICIAAQKNKNPVITWDVAEGFSYKNSSGEEVLRRVLGEGTESSGRTTWYVKELPKVLRLAFDFPGKPEKTIFCILNAHLFFEDPEVVQMLWNMRDEYKKDSRMIVLLGPSFRLPEELKHDIIVLEESLPTNEELLETIKLVYKAGNVKEPESLSREVEAVRGLSLFEAEQASSMSLLENGIDLELLWAKKRKTLETINLKMYKGRETFDDVRGVHQLKKFITMVMRGRRRPTVGLFWDELEKALAGTKGDSSGVTDEMHGQILTWTADNDIPAMRFMGIQGCSKSYISKAVAGEFQIPLIIMNISEQKGGIVGESTTNLKNCLKTVLAIGDPLLMATCNKEEALSAELRDRFNLGTWFFDLPSEQGQLDVFDIWMKKLDIKSTLPSDFKGWTPRNIHDCCSLAWRLKISLEEASKFIVPIVRSSPETITNLRRTATGKYLSVDYEGTYETKKFSESEAIRAIEVSGRVGEA